MRVAKIMEKTHNYQLLYQLTALCWLFAVACAGSRNIPVYSGAIADSTHSRSIVLIGDTQSTGFWEFWRESNDAFRKKIVDRVASENPACILHVGDVVFQGSSSSHWEEFDDNARELQKRGIPIFPVLGNHEYFGNNEDAQAHYFSRFPATRNRQWYSFQFDSLGFLLLNSNFDEMTGDEISRQNEWYSRELQRFQNDPAISAIIAVCHHPPFTNSTVVEDNPDVHRYFAAPFTAAGKARLFVSGHCHSYEHFVVHGKHFVVTGGGGGPRQEVETDPGKQRHRDLYTGAALRPLHFCTLTIEDKGIRVRMIRLDEETGNWSEGDNFLIP